MFNNSTRYLPFSLSVWYNVYITADTKGGRTQPGGGGSAKDNRGTLFTVDTELSEPVQAAFYRTHLPNCQGKIVAM